MLRHPLTHVRAGRYRARTGRRHEVTQAISPVGCCLARDGQRLGMSTKRDAARPFGLGIFCGGRYRTRTATTTTAACGRNREELLGQRSDFSRPRQGAEEKSANATRKAARSDASNQPSGLLLSPRWPTARNVYQERTKAG